MIYLSVFLSSIFFLYVLSKINYSKNKLLFSVLLGIAAILPAILSGVRDLSVGTDVQFYIVPNFELAISSESLLSYLQTIYAKEPLYCIIVYLIAKLTHNIHLLLFVFSFVTVSCVYIGAIRIGKKYNVSYLMICVVYLLMFYNETYNMIRQHVAMAILFAGLIHVIEKDYKKYLLYVFFAVLVHATSVIGICLPLIHWFISSKYPTKSTMFKEVLILLGMFVVCVFPQQVFSVLVAIGLLSDRLLYYFQQNSVSNNNLLNIVLLMLLATLFLFRLSLSKKIYGYDFWLMNAVVSLMLLQLSRVMYYGNRISEYFCLANIVAVAQLDKMTTKKHEKIVICFLTIIVALIYWYYIYVIGNNGETFPYKCGI